MRGQIAIDETEGSKQRIFRTKNKKDERKNIAINVSMKCWRKGGFKESQMKTDGFARKKKNV